MHLRIKKYLSSPLGIYCRVKRDLPFLIRGKSFYADLARRQPFPPAPSPRYNPSTINAYWANHAKRKAKSVVYTCITNGYDDLSIVANHGYTNPDWDYVCFTDDQEQIALRHIGIWQIRPLAFSKLDATRNNRWHKMHPHLLFEEYKESIYLDANIDILSPFIFDTIKERQSSLILPVHDVRHCIFEEYELFLSEFVEETARITAGWRLLKKDGMPRNLGLTENNLLYRRHHDLQIIQFMEAWWKMITDYSRRDQLSFMYLVWKRHLDLTEKTISNTRRLPKDFFVFRHTPRALTK